VEIADAETKPLADSDKEKPAVVPKPPKKSPLAPLLFSVLGILVVGGIAYGAYWYGRHKRPALLSSPAKSSPSPIPTTKTLPTFTPLPPVPTTSPNKSSTHYYLKISLKSPNRQPPDEEYLFLGEYLQEILDLPKDKRSNEVISKIAYDTREGDPFAEENSKYNFNYYLVLKEGQIDTSRKYEDEYLEIRANSINSGLEPFIDNPEYCETDNDCVIRYEFCTYGSYNSYHDFADVWGCGSLSDKSGYTFQIFDDERGCTTDVQFSGSKCVSNKCVEQNRTIVCIDGEPLTNP
jgi:hypothetical protein